MSHHIVTVCVVCVLCAAHVHCSAHTNSSMQHVHTSDYLTILKNSTNSNIEEQPSWTLIKSNEISYSKSQHKSYPNNFNSTKRDTVRYHNAKYVSNNDSRLTANVTLISSNNNPKRKTKKTFNDGEQSSVINTDAFTESRNADFSARFVETTLLPNINQNSAQYNKDSHNRPRLKRDIAVDDKYFMRKIFEAYGDGTSITMEGFEKLVRKLGLLTLLTDVPKLEDGDSVRDNDKSFPSKDLHNADSKDSKERCLNSQELLTTVAQDMHHTPISYNATTLPSWLFERVCPVLVYQLTAESSQERNGCIRVPKNYKSIVIDKFYTTDKSMHNTVQVWIYSTISILVISLSGLLGVVVIPIMGKTYYHQVLQFLVALAVGTLTGDALIHLLPHAMLPPHHHEQDDHQEFDHRHQKSNASSTSHEEQHNVNMWKGAVAMISLVMFFFTEKALTILSEWYNRRQHRNKLHTRVRVMRETDGPNSNIVGEKLCKHKYSSYPYCYGEIANETQDNHHNRRINHHDGPPIIEEAKPLTSNCNSVTKIVSNDMEKKSKEDWRLDDTIVNNAKKNMDTTDVSLNESESYTVIIREHETKHHGHSHSHGHVHSAPESMSSVVWMVLMGDGLHNFTDGMAIGAAFSANIAGGFSTAIAVFCHELPHELGDFAVLLKAGMSAKRAVFYNLLSSLLCLVGMLCGVLLGSTPATTSWVFAAAAGIFIYIALVDMIPELSSSHSAERGSRWQCVLQGLGLLTGLGIMLIIALYEHDLKHIFNN